MWYKSCNVIITLIALKFHIILFNILIKLGVFNKINNKINKYISRERQTFLINFYSIHTKYSNRKKSILSSCRNIRFGVLSAQKSFNKCMPVCISFCLYAALEGKVFNRYPPNSQQTYQLRYYLYTLSFQRWLVTPQADYWQKRSEAVVQAEVDFCFDVSNLYYHYFIKKWARKFILCKHAWNWHCSVFWTAQQFGRTHFVNRAAPRASVASR